MRGRGGYGKRIPIVAGSNGAGKTTFACEFLPREGDCPTFINADLIASVLSPFVPERAAVRAGRMVLQLIEVVVADAQTSATYDLPVLLGSGGPQT